MEILEIFQIDVIQKTISELWQNVTGVLPEIIAAIFVIIIGLIVAPILGGIVKKILDSLRIDKLLKDTGVLDLLSDYSPKLSVSLLLGRLVKWFFLLAFFMAAADIMGWNRVTQFLIDIIYFIPDVLIAIVILVLSIIAGKFVEVIVTRSIHGFKAPVHYPEGFGKAVKWIFIVFGVMVALFQIGVAADLIEILFAGVVLALALAFGIGGKEKAAKLLDTIDKASNRRR